jgi:hypothetical protein
MKSKLVFVLPTLLLVGFLSIKPPAISKVQNEPLISPTSTTTPDPKPNLRDFDDDGDYQGPTQNNSTPTTPGTLPKPNLNGYGDDDEDDEDDHGGRDHHDDDEDEDESDEDGED